MLDVWSAGFVLGRTADAAAEEFLSLDILPVEYRSPDDKAVARITGQELHVRLDRTSFRASLDDCEVATSTGREQRWGGTLACTGVEGVTPGSDARRVIDLQLEFVLTVPVCVWEDSDELDARLLRPTAQIMLEECYAEASHEPDIAFRG